MKTAMKVVGFVLLCAILTALLSWCSLEAGHLCRSDVHPEKCVDDD